MKETKPKPIAKLTKEQLQEFRSIDGRVEATGRILDQAFRRKYQIWDKVREAYNLGILEEHYVDMRSGEVFELWPKIE